MITDFPPRPERAEHPLRRALLLGALSLALGGCAALSPESSDSSDPSEFSAVAAPGIWSSAPASASSAASATPLAQWWLRFDDAQLSTLVSDALSANTSVRSAQAALRQARALRDVSAAALWPTLGSSASAQRGKSDGNQASNSFSVGLDASWELDIFGGNRSALNASEASARASAASLANVQVSIAAEVALDYIMLRDLQARLAIANDNLVSQQETLQITQWRLQAGLVTELEAEQSRASAEQTSALLPVLQTSIAQTGFALSVLTGRPPSSLSTVLAAVGPLPQARGDLALSLPADTLRQRPDVRAAEHQVSAALASVAQAEAARQPNFSLGGSLGLSALTLGTLSNGASVITGLLAGVTLPVFDGGAARAQVRAQQAALDQATLSYQATILTALKDVENALVALAGDRQRLARLQSAAQAAGNAAALARQRYSSGLVDFQVVLETQRTQLVTQESVAISSANVSTDHVQLYKALGGGWQPTPADLSINAASRTTK